MVQLGFIVRLVFVFLIFPAGVAFTKAGSESNLAYFENGGESPG